MVNVEMVEVVNKVGKVQASHSSKRLPAWVSKSSSRGDRLREQ